MLTTRSLYLSFNPKATGEPMHSLSRVQSCISDITNWMTSKKLMLNSGKTERLVLNACHRPLPPLESITVGRDVIYASHVAKSIQLGLVRWISINGQTSESSLQIGLLPSAQYRLKLGNIYRLLTARCMPLYMHLLRQNLTTLTLSYLSFDRIILTNFSSRKILPHVFWLVLGNMNIFNPS